MHHPDSHGMSSMENLVIPLSFGFPFLKLLPGSKDRVDIIAGQIERSMLINFLIGIHPRPFDRTTVGFKISSQGNYHPQDAAVPLKIQRENHLIISGNELPMGQLCAQQVITSLFDRLGCVLKELIYVDYKGEFLPERY